MIATINRRLFTYTSLLGVFVAASLIIPLFSSNASAIDPSAVGFNAGNIISDNVMTAYDTMTVAQIQAFLKSKNSCDNTDLSVLAWHDATSGYMTDSSGNKYWYDLSNGHFLCMADDTFNGQTAAQIIWQAAQTYDINPQVLIVVLQKEQGLVTDTWPNNIQYQSATGYGCPDGAACDSQYYGLANQVNWTAKMYHAIETASPTWYTPYLVGNNYIQYNPSTSCGGSTVNIQNRATQALYNYTPYQPNAATLDAPMGTTVTCGAYGNLNFYRYFTQWFGNPQAVLSISNISLQQQPFTNAPTTATFSVTNESNQTVNLGNLAVAVRDQNGGNHDFPLVQNVSLSRGATYTYSQSSTIGQPEGTYTFFIARESNGTWMYPPFTDFGVSTNGQITVSVSNQPTITTGLTTSPSSIHANQPVTAQFSVTNNSASSQDLGTFAAIVRDSNGNNYDFQNSGDQTLSAGQVYNYSKTQSFPNTGTYNISIQGYRSAYGWNPSYPVPASSSITTTQSIKVKPQVTLTSPLQLSTTSVHANQNVTATFSVTNFGTTPQTIPTLGVALYDSNNNNYGYPAVQNVTIQPGATYTYSQTRSLPNTGNYNAWITAQQQNGVWSSTYPTSETSNLARATTFSVSPQVQLTQPLTVTTSDPKAGQQINATFSITNYGSTAQNIGTVGIAGRDSNNDNYGFPVDQNITIQPGATYTYNLPTTLPLASKYSLWVTDYQNGVWSSTYPTSSTTSLVRSLTLDLTNSTYVTTPLAITTSGTSATAALSVTNNSSQAQTYAILIAAVRDSKGGNHDIVFATNLTIQPGQTYNSTATASNLPVGNYTAWVANYNGSQWFNNIPANQNSSWPQTVKFSV